MAQSRVAVVSVRENLRAEPNGVVVAVVEPGISLSLVRQQGSWVEVVLEGWAWEASLQTRDGGAYDFRVGADGGENLRARPSGDIVARLEEGALLREVDRAPGWIRVQRQAWMWAPSVDLRDASPNAGGAASTPPPSVGSPTSGFRAGPSSPVLNAPDGDTLTVLRPGTELAVLARQGNWARVRLEGWVWMPPVEIAVAGESGGEASLDLTLDGVLANPEAARGRLVTWELQFVSLEEAEAVRTDFYEGEPFLLTRPVGEDATRFVYVAIPPEQMTVASGLTPLERVTVVGRVRTAASALTGAPILDLVELRRRR
ncbi:MAG: hypothetical protein JSU98_10375 [Gemmatimonadales bacterium]|nr:MAG: hypothetical protein JSU98_10375 [Gemmatimonadales bacterium]